MTRTTRSIHIPLAKRGQLLLPGETIASPETGLSYTVERLIGEGGFGQTSNRSVASASVCQGLAV